MLRNAHAYVVVAVCILGTGIICTPAAGAANEPDSGHPPAASSPWAEGHTPRVPWRQMAYGGAVLLTVGAVALYLWKHRGLPATGAVTEVLESRPVDAEMSVHLLKVGDRIFVVASTGEAVRKIGEVDEDALPAPDSRDGKRADGHFRTVLRTVLGRRQQ